MFFPPQTCWSISLAEHMEKLSVKQPIGRVSSAQMHKDEKAKKKGLGKEFQNSPWGNFLPASLHTLTLYPFLSLLLLTSAFPRICFLYCCAWVMIVIQISGLQPPVHGQVLDLGCIKVKNHSSTALVISSDISSDQYADRCQPAGI